MRKITALFILFLFVNVLSAQEASNKIFEIGAEVQKYPTGILLSIRGEIGFTSHHSIDFRVGYNGLDHMDFGVHDSEIGGGFGGSIGYRYYFHASHKNWFLGPRVDLWNNIVDWEDFDDSSQDVIASGESDIFVLQPTLVGGYHWLVNEHLALTPTLAFGAEINIITRGAEIGQGAILLAGATLTYRF